MHPGRLDFSLQWSVTEDVFSLKESHSIQSLLCFVHLAMHWTLFKDVHRVGGLSFMLISYNMLFNDHWLKKQYEIANKRAFQGKHKWKMSLMFLWGPSMKYITLQKERGLRECDSLWQGMGWRSCNVTLWVFSQFKCYVFLNILITHNTDLSWKNHLRSYKKLNLHCSVTARHCCMLAALL